MIKRCTILALALLIATIAGSSAEVLEYEPVYVVSAIHKTVESELMPSQAFLMDDQRALRVTGTWTPGQDLSVIPDAKWGATVYNARSEAGRRTLAELHKLGPKLLKVVPAPDPDGVKAIAALESLEVLDISTFDDYATLRGFLDKPSWDALLASIPRLQALRELRLPYCPMDPLELRALLIDSSIDTIMLQLDDFTFDHASEIADYGKIKNLTLVFNSADAEALRVVAGMPGLTTLSLGCNGLLDFEDSVVLSEGLKSLALSWSVAQVVDLSRLPKSIKSLLLHVYGVDMSFLNSLSEHQFDEFQLGLYGDPIAGMDVKPVSAKVYALGGGLSSVFESIIDPETAVELRVIQDSCTAEGLARVIGKCNNLRRLSVADLDSNDWMSAAAGRELDMLSVFNWVQPVTGEQLAQFKHLSYLSLGQKQIGPDIAQAVAAMPKLRFFKLERTQGLAAEALKHLAGSASIEHMLFLNCAPMAEQAWAPLAAGGKCRVSLLGTVVLGSPYKGAEDSRLRIVFPTLKEHMLQFASERAYAAVAESMRYLEAHGYSLHGGPAGVGELHRWESGPWAFGSITNGTPDTEPTKSCYFAFPLVQGLGARAFVVREGYKWFELEDDKQLRELYSGKDVTWELLNETLNGLELQPVEHIYSRY